MDTTNSELLECLRKNDLLGAALLAGKIEDPNFDPTPYREQVMELAARAWHLCGRRKNDVVLKADAIREVLFSEFGFEGKTDKYKQVIDDPNRYMLHRVLEKKKGCPLSLSMLYWCIAEQLGLSVECYALPNYYLLKTPDIVGPIYIDAFDKGKLLKPEEFHRKFRVSMEKNRMLPTNLFEKVNAYQFVARMVQQLKHVYILKGDALVALRAVEMLAALFPQSPEITRDRGILYCEMEYFSKAIEDLRFYLKKRPNAEDVAEIKKLTTMLKGYREIMN